MTMSKKKQGFISKNIILPFKPVTRILASGKTLLPLFGQKKLEFNSWVEEARDRLKNPALSNFNLGKDFLEGGKISDAVARLKLAVFLRKDYAEAYYWLGKSYLFKVEVEKAKACFEKAKSFNYANEEFDYFYNIYNNQKSSAYPSKSLRNSYFEKIAKIFDDNYINYLNYKGIDKIFEIFKDVDKGNNSKILELGCGNGLLGEKLKQHNNNLEITGLDFAKNMIKNSRSLTYDASGEEIIDLRSDKGSELEERKSNVYSFLIRADLDKFENSQNKKYNMVVARGFFDYISDLNSAFELISKVLAKEANLIFYIREAYSKEQLNIVTTEYSHPFFCNHFAHSKDNLVQIGKKYSFNLVSVDDFQLEKNVKGQAFIFKFG